jgi:hypothetical protein
MRTLQLRELFYDHHEDYQPKIDTIFIRGGTNHEIETDKLLET